MARSIGHYVLKVASRCDLSCDHCYVYHHKDQSWRDKPKIFAEDTAKQTAIRITEHAVRHRLASVQVVVHGGEPLLLGTGGLRSILHMLRTLVEPVSALDLRVHTNGVLLDQQLCELFAEFNVSVGVSLDGDQAANDRHRRFADGRSSFVQVREALALLREPGYRHLYAGILCTVDVRNDPVAVYRALLAERPPRLDLLLPHATWDSPPDRPGGSSTPYAEWLGRLHHQWVADGRPVPIRLFDSWRAAWAGGTSSTEAAGLDPVDLLVVETDGTYEQADSLKTAFPGAPETGFNVFDHSVDEVAAHPGVRARQQGAAALSAVCRQCHLVRACGGGLYAHRYKSGRGFSNPAVYCSDLKVLIPQVVGASATKRAPPAADSLVAHSLNADALDLLASGPGDTRAMAALDDSRWSVARALVAAVAAGLGPGRDDLTLAAIEGWKLLSKLDREHPDTVREVISYPYVTSWAMRCLRPGRGRDQSGDQSRDVAHLAGLAAAVALRAGVATRLPVASRDGYVYVPTIGRVAVAGGRRLLDVHISPRGLKFGDHTGGWHPVRRVDAGPLAVTVDDVDPFRDCKSWTPAGRLPPAAWRVWRRALAAAARQLDTQLPAYAPVVAMGLRSIVPIRPGSGDHQQSGSARQAFGAVALTLPADIDSLSVLLLHEMQHVKLGALCDLIELFDRDDRRLFAVPWRSDGRPVEGLLHGTYAHLAIAEYWLSRALRSGGTVDRRHFLQICSWVEDAIEQLQASGALTSAGDRFVSGMSATIDGWER